MKKRSRLWNKSFHVIAFTVHTLFCLGLGLTGNAQSPVITNPSVSLQGITEDILTTSNNGTLVSTLLSGAATDVNGDAIGIAVVSRDATNGTWQFFESGIWWNFDRTAVASATQALLLPPNANIRFTPASNYNGSATFTFRAWDQRSGTAYSTGNTSANGGNTAYSSTTGTATIAVSSVNDAPVINSTVGIPGITFDGANDHVSFPNPSISGDYTIEAWVYINQHQTWSRIVDLGNGPGSNNVLFAFQGGTNQLVMETYTGTGGILASPSAVPTGVWKHLACVNNGAGTGYLYIDGVQVASGAQNSPANIARSLNYIARSNWGQDSYFNGTIREVRIWDVARTQAQISQNKDIPLLGNETGLKVYFRTNEGSGTTLNDASGNGKTGTLQNGPTWTTYGTPLSNLLVTEDITTVIPGFETLDVDAGTNPITFTLSVSSGVIKVLTNVVNGVTAGDVTANNSPSVTITSTVTKINATLAANGLAYAPNANYSGPDKVVMNLVDNGHSGSGGTLSASYSFNITVTPVNDAPVITSTAVTTVDEDAAYSYTIVATDPDAGNILTYSAPVLPSWMTFNAATRVLSGSPTNTHVGTHNVTLRVNDGTVNTDQSFVITVANINDAPVISSTPVTAVNEDAVYTYTIVASDVDAGSVLTYSSFVLPAWLTFNPATRTLSGTPTNDEVGPHNVTLRVSDGTVNVDQVFVITVANVNDAPTITSTAVTSVDEDAVYTYTIVASDVDAGNTLTYSAPVLPAWLTFNSTTRVLSGTPANAQVGTHNVTLRVNDGTVNVDQAFVITVVNTNDAPSITSTAVTSINQDEAYTYTIVAADVDVGNTLTYSAPVLPAWLTFNPATRILSGTPTNSVVGIHDVTLRVNDGTVDSDQVFQITVVNINDAPVITSVAVVSVDEDDTYTYTFSASDVDADDVLTYSAPVLPSWLSFNPSTGILSGTPTNSAVGIHNVTLRVNDGAVNVDQVFTIAVANTNDAPVINSTAVTTVNEDAAYAYTISASDVDAGAVLTYSAPLLPSWLAFNTTTRVLSGTPTNSAVGTHNVTLRVSDGTIDVDQAFTITVANINDAPVINSSAITSVDEDALYAYTIVAQDIDVGDILTYTAIVLPDWLIFNTTTHILSGTPANDDVGTHNVTLRVSDGTLNVDQVFTITVVNTNDAPAITSTPGTSVNEDTGYSYTLSASDIDAGAVLTYTAPVLPAWLTFNTTTRVLSGTPTNSEVGMHSVTLRVNDGTVTTDQVFTLTVININDAPVINSVAVTSVNEDEAYTYTLVATDVDVDDVLTYSAPVLPAWLTFNTTTRVLSATPANNDVGIHNVTLRVSDGSVNVDQVFTVTVANINDAPVITSTAVTSINEDAAYAYTFTASDVDATDVLAYTAPVLPTWLTFNQTTKTLSGTPANSDVGIHNVTLRVSDGIVNVDQVFTITVVNINDAPVISSAAPASINEDTPYAYTITASDVDAGDVLTYSAPVLPSWLSFDATTGALTGLPTNNDVGIHAVTLRVSDGTVNTDQEFSITVVNINDAPVISSTPIVTVDEDAEYAYTISASDVDAGTTLAYEASVLPYWLSFDAATRLLSGTPANDAVGIHQVTLRVKDGTVSVDQVFSITVTNTNDAPVITSSAVEEAEENAVYTYTITADEVDADDILTFSAPVLPSWLTFNAITGTLSGTPGNSDVGTHNATLRVSDGTLNIDQTFVITVGNVNDNPAVTSVAITAVDEDALYSYTFAAADVDATDVLTYIAPVLPAWLTFDPSTGILSGTPTNSEVGVHPVTLRVSDGTVSVDEIFSITVANTNDAPVISSDVMISVEEDHMYAYTINATDVDAGDLLTYSVPVLPEWLTFDTATRLLSGTPTNDEVGSHILTLRVNDGTVDVEQTFTITVSNTNDAPIITSSAPTSVNEDALYTYTFAATDVDAADVLVYSASELPGWLSFNAQTGELSGTPANEDVGSYDITLRVSDATVEIEQSFTIVVSNTNDAPVITSAAITAAKETFNYSYTITATDDDANSQLIFSASVLPSWLTFNSATATLEGTPSPSEAGTYTVTLTVSDGITSVDQVFIITVAPNISPVVQANQVFSIAEGSAKGTDVGIVLAADADGDALGGWTIVDGNIGNAFSIDAASGQLKVNSVTLDYEEHSSFTLVVTVTDGFTTSLPTPVTVVISDVMEGLKLYSAFSPNGDGINDTFEIDGLEAYPNSHVKIFNSDGIELFSNVGYTVKWDGFYKGKEMPLGTYFYLINLNDGSKKTLNGHFMIIK